MSYMDSVDSCREKNIWKFEKCWKVIWRCPKMEVPQHHLFQYLYLVEWIGVPPILGNLHIQTYNHHYTYIYIYIICIYYVYYDILWYIYIYIVNLLPSRLQRLIHDFVTIWDAVNLAICCIHPHVVTFLQGMTSTWPGGGSQIVVLRKRQQLESWCKWSKFSQKKSGL